MEEDRIVEHGELWGMQWRILNGQRTVGWEAEEVGSRKWVLTLRGRTTKPYIQFSTGPRISH